MSNEITVYVRTCQGNDPVTFKARMIEQSKVRHIQHYLLDQWRVAQHEFQSVPPSEHSYTFQGQLLNLDANLDMFHIKHGDTIYLRMTSRGKVHDANGMSTTELRAELKRRGLYQKGLNAAQMVSVCGSYDTFCSSSLYLASTGEKSRNEGNTIGSIECCDQTRRCGPSRSHRSGVANV